MTQIDFILLLPYIYKDYSGNDVINVVVLLGHIPNKSA